MAKSILFPIWLNVEEQKKMEKLKKKAEKQNRSAGNYIKKRIFK